MALSAIFMSSRVHVGCLKRRDAWKTRSTLYKHLIYLSLSKACSNTWWTAPKTPARIFLCAKKSRWNTWSTKKVGLNTWSTTFLQFFSSLPVFILLLLLFFVVHIFFFCVLALLVLPLFSFILVLLLSLWSKRRKIKTEQLQNRSHFEKYKPGTV